MAGVRQLLEKLGVKVNEIKSGPLKANPSPFQPLDEAGRSAAEEMVAESQRWFLGSGRAPGAASRRKSVPGLEQGRVFSGREALSHKLIDQIGGEAEAVKYLEEQRNVPKGLKVVDWKPSRDYVWGFATAWRRWPWRVSPALRGAVDELARLSDDRLASLRLDGLLSVWHGAER